MHQFNVDILSDLLCLFACPAHIEDEGVLWNMIYAFYLDPDSCAVKQLAGIECSADGLFSMKRIYRKYGLSEDAIAEYESNFLMMYYIFIIFILLKITEVT